MRLLIVSAQSEVRDYLASVCRYFGYEVDCLDSGWLPTLECSAPAPYAVILYDALSSDDSDEFEILRRAMPESEIMVLSLPNDDDFMWRQRGAASVLGMPIMPGHLKLEILRRITAAA